MRAKSIIGIVAILVGLCAAGAAVADDYTYIGASKCKMCHKVEYTSWLETPHAKAFDQLKGDEQSNPECLSCHATGNDAAKPGVQCESCHGPGSGYKSMKVMKDQEASIAAGLQLANEETCQRCHGAGKAPHEMKAFDFATASKTGLHAKKGD